MNPPRLLVVDDTPANIRLIGATLEPHGFTILAAANGEEALDAVERDAPDLVLLDIQMPGMNGYEVCRRIRGDLERPALPIVMVTASAGEERSLALAAGADDFVVRPFDHAELLARVRSLLRIKAYHDELERQARELEELNAVLEERVAEQVVELERLRALRRFLPPHLAEAIMSDGQDLLSPHRREVAVLSCRLEGFPRMVASAEPEDVVAAVRDFHTVLGRLIASTGATVGLLAGDAVTMFFNDPLPCPDPVRHAVDLASSIRDAMSGVVAEPWRHRGHDLALTIGISYGYATLGMLGFEGRYDYGAVGGVVEEASRLAAAAGNGEIFLGERAFAAIETQATCRQVEVDGGGRAWALEASRPACEGTSEPSIEVRVLGPLEAVVDGCTVAVTAAKERALLTLLAMRPGTVLSAERLADELWEGAPPESAATTLRAYVSRLRKTLAAAGAGHALVTRATGYSLEIDAAAVDATRFEAMVRRGHALLSEGDAASAAELLRDALALWRGAALADVASMTAAAAEVARLDELRLIALEDRVDAELALGRHREVLTELERLTLDHPLRERFWAQRMLALYRSGRQPEALRAYQALRTQLVDELGLEPSPDLVGLEAAILARAPELDDHVRTS